MPSEHDDLHNLYLMNTALNHLGGELPLGKTQTCEIRGLKGEASKGWQSSQRRGEGEKKSGVCYERERCRAL